MRMKEDPMMNGQLKPGYNVQIATQNQFVLYYYVCQRPTDQRTLIPFLKEIDRKFEHIVADAGYGSEPNYDYVINEYGAVPLIPYTMYLKELTRKYRRDLSKRQNWLYERNLDRYTDEHGVKFTKHSEYDCTDKYGHPRYFIKYTAIEGDAPELYHYATTKTGNRRSISVNPHWEVQKDLIRQKLSDSETAAIFARRKIEDEPVFGNLKANMNFNRFTVRGKKAVNNEMGLVLMAGNLQKLTNQLSSNSELMQKFERFIAFCLRTQKYKQRGKVA